jgi:protein SCO1
MKRLVLCLALFGIAAALPACRRDGSRVNVREFPLTGQILTIKPDRTEARVKHDAVSGFMDAMTMDFTIRNPKELDGLLPGDLIAATLVITDEEGYLRGIRKTGTAPIAPLPADTAGTVPELRPGEEVPEIAFVGDDGKPRPLSGFRGKYVLLTFVYTRCPLPDYCPRMNGYFSALQKAIAARPSLRAQVRLLSVSFDPDFDTPAQLRKTASGLGADPAIWQFVTAPREAVDAFGARFGLSVIREGPNGQTITHNLRTPLVGRDGRLVKQYNGNDWSPDDVVRDLEGLVK